jgi:hypothetical protein
LLDLLSQLPLRGAARDLRSGSGLTANRKNLDLLCCFPCGRAACDLRSGSGLTANRINLPNASELYPAFDWASRSPRPALCYRPLRTLLVAFRCPSQSRRFFQVRSPGGSPRPADHPVYFGSARFIVPTLSLLSLEVFLGSVKSATESHTGLLCASLLPWWICLPEPATIPSARHGT